VAIEFAVLVVPALALVLAVAGFALIRSGWRIHRQGRCWPSVEGEVIESGVSTSSRKGITLWRARIRCRYALSGRVVECEPDSRVQAWEYAKAGNPLVTAARYKVGTRVTLRYDPGNETVAVLQSDMARDVLPFHALGGLFIAASVFLMVHAYG